MKALLVQTRQNEGVDRGFCPVIALENGRKRRLDWLLKRPVRPIDRTLFDPLPQDGNISDLHGFCFALRGLWHQVMRVLRLDALDQLTLFRMSSDDGIRMASPLSERRLFQVQPQPSLAHLRVGPMATETVAGQNRLHILIEINPLRTPHSVAVSLPLVAAYGDSQQQSGQAQQWRRGAMRRPVSNHAS